MSHGDMSNRESTKITRRANNQAGLVSRGVSEMGGSMKYELKNHVTGNTAELNAMPGTLGPDALDISHLFRDMGIVTYDPGFMATASTESKITYIDGDAGILLYRGYPVEQLA
jgi:hypothetical protein